MTTAMGKRGKPAATLSLDLDNAWSYLKIHGDEGWQSFPSYLDAIVPRFLQVFDELSLQVTVFIVGQDAALAKNRAALGAIARAGHEIGNHSFRHEPWLHLYSEGELEEEITRAEQAIELATGRRTQSFRGPGFSSSEAVLSLLARRAYRCDASSFPTFLGPLARAYYFLTTRLNVREKAKRKQLFGNWKDGFKPLRAHRTEWKGKSLWEVPVTTMPILRLPFHLSYLLYIAAISPALATFYFKVALWLCTRLRVSPSLLLHPLDFASLADEPRLSFFPAMRLPLPEKLSLVRRFLVLFAERFDVLPISAYCDLLDEHAAPVAAAARVYR